MKAAGLWTFMLFTFAVSSFGQSIADIARQERQRQQAAHSSIVITNNGTTSATAGSEPTDAVAAPATPAPAAAAAATSGIKPGEITDRNGHNEKYWRELFQKAREDAKRAEARAQVLDLQIKQLNTELLQNSNLYNRENRLGADMTARQKELDEARKEAERTRKKLSDLEDELRKAGGPAGWAR